MNTTDADGAGAPDDARDAQPGVPDEAAAGDGRFPTRHWSVVLAAGAESESQARAALATLCERYWYPLYVFARRQGRPHHEAEDCTQGFLARLLADDGLARAQPERGRFRTFLLTAMRNYLINEWRRTQAAKRGGGAAVVDLPADAEQRFARELADDALTPEQAFDRAWALQLIDAALDTLRAEYAKRGDAALFAAAVPLVWGGEEGGTHAERAARLGLNEHAFTVAVQRLRRRVGDRLRATVAETVPANADIEAELRYLVEAVGGAPARAG